MSCYSGNVFGAYLCDIPIRLDQAPYADVIDYDLHDCNYLEYSEDLAMKKQLVTRIEFAINLRKAKKEAK